MRKNITQAVLIIPTIKKTKVAKVKNHTKTPF